MQYLIYTFCVHVWVSINHSTLNFINIVISVSESEPHFTTSHRYSSPLQRRTHGKRFEMSTRTWMVSGFKVSSWLSGSFSFPLCIALLLVSFDLVHGLVLSTVEYFYNDCRDFQKDNVGCHTDAEVCEHECSKKWWQWNQPSSGREMRGHFSFSQGVNLWVENIIDCIIHFEQVKNVQNAGILSHVQKISCVFLSCQETLVLPIQVKSRFLLKGLYNLYNIQYPPWFNSRFR